MDECRTDGRGFDAELYGLQIAAATLGAAIERNRLEKALREREASLREENVRLRSTFKNDYKFGEIIGKSKPMQKVYENILQAASTDANVIICGKSGTGKELVAKAIHDTSRRREKAFVPINCGAIPETILESEFFGYKKGAFTGATRDKRGYLDVADGGTLFLDEVGELSPNMQAKLLRAIDGGGYTPVGGCEVKRPNLRIIAATNRDLAVLVKEGLMREDFFYRMHIIPIRVPLLRHRKGDIPLLIYHFLEKYCDDGRVPFLSGQMMETLKAYHWPGNVRELQNVLRRFIAVGRLEFSDHFELAGHSDDERAQKTQDLVTSVEAFERKHIEQALEQTHWHRGEAASLLGVCRKTLQRKMKRYGLEHKVQ